MLGAQQHSEYPRLRTGMKNTDIRSFEETEEEAGFICDIYVVRKLRSDYRVSYDTASWNRGDLNAFLKGPTMAAW